MEILLHFWESFTFSNFIFNSQINGGYWHLMATILFRLWSILIFVNVAKVIRCLMIMWWSHAENDFHCCLHVSCKMLEHGKGFHAWIIYTRKLIIIDSAHTLLPEFLKCSRWLCTGYQNWCFKLFHWAHFLHVWYVWKRLFSSIGMCCIARTE